MSEWQPIDTAPRDGTEILICDAVTTYTPYRAYPALWEPEYGWRDPDWDGGYDPTHWMPMPPPPKTGDTK